MTSNTLSPPRALFRLVADVVGDRATVEMQTDPEAALRLPLVVVGLSTPVAIPTSHRAAPAASVTLVTSVYAETPSEGLDLAEAIHATIHEHPGGTPFGHVTNIRGTTLPRRVPSDVPTATRHDFTADIILTSSTTR